MRNARQKGFTLVEIITVILLLGIIGVMGADIITSSFRGFSDTDATMELFEEGKLALMRMEREIHHMVPNAVDTPTSDSILFGLIDVNTLTAAAPAITGQYNPIGGSSKIIDLSGNPLPAASTLLSIYNTNWNDFTSNLNTERKIYDITTTGAPPGSMTLDRAVIGGHSSTRRYYPVEKAIRYFRNGNTLFRAETSVTLAPNPFETTLTSLAGYPLLSNLDTTIPNPILFTYIPSSLTRNALVQIDFTLASNGISIDFHKEIQVRNVP
ncbi:MAG: type II secretion system protein [Thermodesulfobacteriota bacterium]